MRRSDRPAWHLLTGEYPPKPGGVADYTRALACGLAAVGEEVHVWTPRFPGDPPDDPGVVVHVLAHGFSPRGLVEISKGLARERRLRRLLVQYVPHAYGMKAMNLPFCAWLATRSADDVWVMLHEVAFPLRRPDPLRHQVLAVVTHVMAAIVALRAARLFVSTPAWSRMLATFLPRPPETTWLPIPSNLPTRAPPDAVVRARSQLPKETVIIGHFGTYGLMAPLLGETLRRLLAKPGRTALLLGRGGKEFAQKLKLDCAPGSSVVAMGRMPSDELVALLAACDVVVQPYSDGISTRRTSVMASLALGVPIVTTVGVATEPIWAEADAVVLAEHDATALTQATEALLDDVGRRRALRERGQTLYNDAFSLECTLQKLRAEAATAS